MLFAATTVVYGEFDELPPASVLVAAGVLLVVVVVVAFLVGRRPRPATRARVDRPERRGLGLLVGACMLAHWVLTYSVAETELAWPLGVALALLPVVVALVLVPRLAVTGPYGSDGVRVVVGLLSFFVLLDVLVALLGRYDMILSAILSAWLARRLYRRRRSVGFEAAERTTASP